MKTLEGCPGQDNRRKKPEGMVYSVECARCRGEVEFFYDDVIRECSVCGNDVLGEASKLENLGCAEWCEAAEKCLGQDLYKKIMMKTGRE